MGYQFERTKTPSLVAQSVVRIDDIDHTVVHNPYKPVERNQFLGFPKLEATEVVHEYIFSQECLFFVFF